MLSVGLVWVGQTNGGIGAHSLEGTSMVHDAPAHRRKPVLRARTRLGGHSAAIDLDRAPEHVDQEDERHHLTR